MDGRFFAAEIKKKKIGQKMEKDVREGNMDGDDDKRQECFLSTGTLEREMWKF